MNATFESVKYANDRAEETDEGGGSDNACQIGRTTPHLDAVAAHAHRICCSTESRTSALGRVRGGKKSPLLRDTGPA